jgi:hypothetical protein
MEKCAGESAKLLRGEMWISNGPENLQAPGQHTQPYAAAQPSAGFAHWHGNATHAADKASLRV